MPKTTPFPATTRDPFRNWHAAEETDELATRIVGGHVIMMAMVGICSNVFMFFHFLKKEKLSFYILCTSKTVSNTIALLIYLCYIGPVQLFYTAIGSMDFGARLQQVFGGGLLLQGPMTQMLITVNRFLVITFSPTTVPKYSTHITVAALAIVWIMFLWWSTLLGFPEHCFNPFFFDHVGYYGSICNQKLVKYQVMTIFLLAVFNNGMNFILAIKLAISAKKQKSISSEIARTRRKRTVRFFIQSCIQDWAMAIVMGTNAFLASIFCRKHSCVMLPSFTLDATAYAADGLVMFLFNYSRSPKRIIKVESSNSVAPTSRTSIAN